MFLEMYCKMLVLQKSFPDSLHGAMNVFFEWLRYIFLTGLAHGLHQLCNIS